MNRVQPIRNLTNGAIVSFCEICNALYLPAKAAPGQTYAEAVKEKVLYAERTLRFMDDGVFTPSFYARLHEILDEHYTKENAFCKCADLLQAGDVHHAKDIFNSAIESVLSFYFELGDNRLTSSGLYRIRKSETPLNARKDMFHVPQTVKRSSSDNRFGLEDAPCLYLATSSNLAWLESKMPVRFCISRFWPSEITLGWKIICLTSPQRFYSTQFSPAATHPSDPKRRENQERMILAYFRQLPLIIACSFVVNPQTIIRADGRKCTIIPEYQIPNLLMAWVKENHDRTKYKGVAYDSSSLYEEYLRVRGFNVAIPTFDIDGSGYCKTLREAFRLTKPKWVDLAGRLTMIKEPGEKYLNEYRALVGKLNSPNWETLKMAASGLTHLLTFFERDDKYDNAEAFYDFLCSVRCTFDLLRTADFKDWEGQPLFTLNKAASDVSDALHHLIDDISWVKGADFKGAEFVRQFDYIEGSNGDWFSGQAYLVSSEQQTDRGDCPRNVPEMSLMPVYHYGKQ